jgi:hypothetical protein
MTQALYARMNNKTIKIKRKEKKMLALCWKMLTDECLHRDW